MIEVLIAVLLFLFIALGLGNSIRASRRAGDSSRSIAEATTLAMDKIEHLRVLPALNAELTEGLHTDGANPLQSDGSTGGIFHRSWRVTRDLPLLGMKTVEMTVTWNDWNGPGKVTLVTYLSLL